MQAKCVKTVGKSSKMQAQNKNVLKSQKARKKTKLEQLLYAEADVKVNNVFHHTVFHMEGCLK